MRLYVMIFGGNITQTLMALFLPILVFCFKMELIILFIFQNRFANITQDAHDFWHVLIQRYVFFENLLELTDALTPLSWRHFDFGLSSVSRVFSWGPDPRMIEDPRSPTLVPGATSGITLLKINLKSKK